MPRKGNVPKREVLPDPVYGSVVVAKLINSIMLDGKRERHRRSFTMLSSRSVTKPVKSPWKSLKKQ